MTLRIKVIPRSKKNEISGELADGTLKVHVTAPPEKGKANKALALLLAEVLEVKKSSVALASGETAREKLFRVSGIGLEAVRAALERALAEA